MIRMRMTDRTRALLSVVLISLLLAGPAVADVLVLQSGKQVRASKITYKRASDEYLVHIGSNRVPYPAAKVKAVKVARPKMLQSARQKMSAGDMLSAIAILKNVERDYRKLNWDLSARAMLAECYFATGDEARAVRICDELAGMPGVSLPGTVNRAYLRALADSGDMQKVQEQVVRMTQTGSREAAAAAQLMHANILYEQEKYMDALVKGYLRTTELFRDIKDVQAEALYGVVRCYRQLGMTKRAEQFQKILTTRHGDSDYAQKLRLES